LHPLTLPAEARYTLIIPAYNEENRIRPLFNNIKHFDGELIAVCDGNDDTADVVEEIASGRRDLNIRCLRFSHRLGKGGGVLEGMKAAGSPFVGYFDADESTSIEEMERLFRQLGSSDAVIGSRWIAGSTLIVQQGFFRQLESRVFNLLIKILFNLDFHDTQCGAKVFRKHAIDQVLPQMVSRGFEFDVELLWRLKLAGYTVTEIPIVWQNKGDSRVRKRDMIIMLTGLFRIRFGRGQA